MGRKGDHSAADVLFAFNCKIPFIPIESFLSGFERYSLFLKYIHLKVYKFTLISILIFKTDQKSTLGRILIFLRYPNIQMINKSIQVFRR